MVKAEYCVYCHTFPNGKKYIGITKNYRKRWQNGHGYTKQIFVHRAILKYGWENIVHEILFDNLTALEAQNREIELIREYKTNDPKYGYNQSIGGESGYSGCAWSETRKELMQQRMTGNRWCVGYKHTDETRKRMSEAQLRREHPPLTEEQILKCIANLPGPQIGGENPAARPVLCVETNTVYPCGKYAAKDLGLQASHISQVCHGKRRTTGGYHFQFQEK